MTLIRNISVGVIRTKRYDRTGFKRYKEKNRELVEKRQLFGGLLL